MTTSPHDSHDLLLVSAWAAGDAGPADEARARAIVDSCAECAALATDIRSIAAATAALPAPVRTRDFRLTEADAARLRPAGWRLALRALTSPTLAFTRPLAAGLTTLGLVGIVVTSVPMGMFSAATGGAAGAGPASSQEPAETRDAPETFRSPAAVGAAPPPGATSVPGVLRGAEVASPAPSGVASFDSLAGGVASPETTSQAPEDTIGSVDAGADPDRLSQGDGALRSEGSGVSPFFALSAAAFLLGLGLFVLRWTARRLT